VRASKFFLAALGLIAQSALAGAGCQNLKFENQGYAACSFAAGDAKIETYNLNAAGEPYRYLPLLVQDIAAQGETLTFAMNAGMYDENQRPIGLYIEDGKQSKKLNRRNGAGNFHLKPNGVFYVKDGKAGVIDTEAYAKSGIKPDFASQSGPMLVINGKIHPKLSPSGTSRKIRNGVGVDAAGTVIFAMSDGPVTFYEFASLFKDEFNAVNALFFDGSISSLYSTELNRRDGFLPLGPMVGASEIK
jgi:uncharacterized protein YigE (DUF2233 family)